MAVFLNLSQFDACCYEINYNWWIQPKFLAPVIDQPGLNNRLMRNVFCVATEHCSTQPPFP